MRIRALASLAVAVALVGCDSASAPSEVINGVAVYTQPQPAADFAPLRTYYLDPAVGIKKDGKDQPDGNLNSAQYAPVLQAITTQMTAAGYTAAAQTLADVGLKLNINIGSVNYYYGGGYCNPYYGWYGCYYPPVYAGSYSYGTAILAMLDLAIPPDPATPYPGLWFSAVYGVVPDSVATSYSRLAGGITRAFEQSPYLRTSVAP